MTLRPGFSYWMFALFAAVLPAQSPMSNQKSSAANVATFLATAARSRPAEITLACVYSEMADDVRHAW